MIPRVEEASIADAEIRRHAGTVAARVVAEKLDVRVG
jgi:hypothetical protein